MDRFRRQHSRELIGAAFVVAAFVAIVIGYANIRDEADVAIQLPYILTGGIGAVVLVAVGVGILRSQDDKAILDRLAEVEATNHEVKERMEYLTHLLEAGLVPDDNTVDVSNAQAPARAR
jgi:hypothetical protein